MSRSARATREHLRVIHRGLEDLAIEMLAHGLSVRDIEMHSGTRTVDCFIEGGPGSGYGRITRFCAGRSAGANRSVARSCAPTVYEELALLPKLT